jgi:hypothetical protein
VSDPSSIWDAVKIGGGTVLGSILAAFAKNFFSSKSDSSHQEKGLRDGLSIRVSQLEKRVGELEARLEVATKQRDDWRYLCLDARVVAVTLAAKHGELPPVWPDDPH